LRWERADRPADFAPTSSPEAVAQIARWLEQAGTEPAGAR